MSINLLLCLGRDRGSLGGGVGVSPAPPPLNDPCEMITCGIPIYLPAMNLGRVVTYGYVLLVQDAGGSLFVSLIYMWDFLDGGE